MSRREGTVAMPPPLAGVHAPAERVLLGIGLMALGVSVLPLMDGIAKLLAGDYAVLQVVWGRFAFHLLWLVPVLAWRARRDALVSRHPGLQLLRGMFLLGATTCFFAALVWMPIADALALLFISPMVTTVLAPVVLRERVGRWRWSAVAAGFIGALIIVRPGVGVFQWAALLALAAGVCHGCYLLTTRRLSGSTRPLVTLLYTALPGFLATSLALPLVWTPPTPQDWMLMAAMGAFAVSGHFLVIRAFEHAPATIVAPIGYAEIVAATAVGYVGFGDLPDAWTWAGIAVIVASGLVITLRERRRAPARAHDDGPAAHGTAS